MGTGRKIPEIVFDEPESLGQARQWLEYVRRSRHPGVSYVISGSIEVIFGKPPVTLATDRDVVEYLLAFANNEISRRRQVEMLRTTAGILQPKDGATNIPPRQQAEAFLSAVKSRRQRLKRTLAAIKMGDLSNTEAFFKPNSRYLQGVWILPRVSKSADGVALGQDTLLLDPDAFETFVLLMLIDPSKVARPANRRRPPKSFRDDLFRCAYCEKFRLVPLTSGRTPKFCPSVECRQNFHNDSAPERMADLRKERLRMKK